jgi:hypothetical protein
MPTHNTKNVHKAIHWARLAAQENQNTITILTIPDEEWTTNDIPYKTKFDDTHVSIHFPPGTIIYKEPTIPPELNKEPQKEALAIRILCIHHQNTEINIATTSHHKFKHKPHIHKSTTTNPTKCQST